LVDCRHGQRGADAVAAGVLVDNDIFDPCSQPGGKREGDQGQHADDDVLAAGDEQGDGLVIGHPGQALGVEWCCGDNRCCPLMTAADRCVGHIGVTADEDEAGSGLAAMVNSSTEGEVGPGRPPASLASC